MHYNFQSEEDLKKIYDKVMAVDEIDLEKKESICKYVNHTIPYLSNLIQHRVAISDREISG